MKQKVIIKLSLSGNDQKCRTKAFKIAVSQPGVESAAMKGQEKNELEVEGEQIDAVVLTSLLRKKLGQAELVSVAAVGGGDNKDKGGSDTKPQASAAVAQGQIPYYYYYTPPKYPVYQIRDSYDDQPSCSIM